jgi:hypothetical protein
MTAAPEFRDCGSCDRRRYCRTSANARGERCPEAADPKLTGIFRLYSESSHIKKVEIERKVSDEIDALSKILAKDAVCPDPK